MDDIEKNYILHNFLKISLKFNFPEAYCVECRTKRKIENPEETTMKNGRSAIKGICSVCHCKVFRTGKM